MERRFSLYSGLLDNKLSVIDSIATLFLGLKVCRVGWLWPKKPVLRLQHFDRHNVTLYAMFFPWNRAQSSSVKFSQIWCLRFPRAMFCSISYRYQNVYCPWGNKIVGSWAHWDYLLMCLHLFEVKFTAVKQLRTIIINKNILYVNTLFSTFAKDSGTYFDFFLLIQFSFLHTFLILL